MTSPLPLAPLAKLLLARMALYGDEQVAEELGYTDRGLHRLVAREQISEWKADELCARLGLHPVEVWGRHWYDIIVEVDAVENDVDPDRCGCCAFGRAKTLNGSAFVECHADPPNQPGAAAWPVLDEHDWCAKFKRKALSAEAGEDLLGEPLGMISRRLRWSTRLRNVVDRLGVTTLRALLSIPEGEVFAERGSGERTRQELRDSLRTLGLEIGQCAEGVKR